MQIFICPVCGATLIKEPAVYTCSLGHRFDRAKTGYVNLLLSQKSAAKHSGDDKKMVRARRDFLNAGYYEPLLQALLQQAALYLQKESILLDAGCGEGYYTYGFKARYPWLQAFGIDLSKEALKEANKRSDTLSLAVASIFHLPVSTASCDLLLNIFAPCCPQEFARVLRSGGLLIRAIPLEKHLWELKEAIYDKPYLNQLHSSELEGFTLKGHQDVEGTLHLCGQDIQNLFMMTPYYYKTSATDQEKCAALQQLDVQTSFRILLYQRI